MVCNCYILHLSTVKVLKQKRRLILFTHLLGESNKGLMVPISINTGCDMTCFSSRTSSCLLKMHMRARTIRSNIREKEV